MLAIPAINTLWFCFDKRTRRALHGTPQDVMRKFDALHSVGLCSEGLEIFLIPERLKHSPDFTPAFYKTFSGFSHRAVHIGETDVNFLDSKTAATDLANLSKVLQKLRARYVVIHAHHLRENRQARERLLRSALGGFRILVENNGFDYPWGGKVESVSEILSDCPEFGFCLDIAHVKDFMNSPLEAFISNELLMSRLAEVHYSYSTILVDGDPYEEKGFYGYGPYHAMFSVLGLGPSHRTREFISNYPVIIEGIVPAEDKNLDFLRKEIEILGK